MALGHNPTSTTIATVKRKRTKGKHNEHEIKATASKRMIQAFLELSKSMETGMTAQN